MLKRIGFTVITLVVAGVCSADLHAQTLQTGTWTGTAVGPDGSSDDVAFGVRTLWWAPDGRRVVFVPDGSQLPGSQLSITYYSAQGQIRLRNIQLEGDTLSFSFTIGGLDVS